MNVPTSWEHPRCPDRGEARYELKGAFRVAAVLDGGGKLTRAIGTIKFSDQKSEKYKNVNYCDQDRSKTMPQHQV